MTNDITAKVERLFERWPEVAEADEHISQAMLDNTSTEISEEGGGMQSARTMVLCNYNDLRIVLGFVDKVRAAREALSSQRAEGIEAGDEGSMYDLGRADALETAAKVAERQFTDAGWNGHYYNAGVVIARAIRALTRKGE